MSRKIRRNYNQPFFSSGKSGGNRWLFLLGILIGAGFVFVYLQLDRLQIVALDALGVAPTATPFASDRAALGTQLYSQGNIEAAAQQFALAVEQQPQNIDYLYEYGRILIELDRNAEAREIGNQAIEIAPDDPRGYALKSRASVWSNPGEAIPTAILGLDKDSNFAPLRAVLAIAYTRDRLADALVQGAIAIELDPMDPFVRRAYSIPLIFNGRTREAIEQLEQAIAINPNLPAPYYELAAQYRALEQEEMAVSIYQRILEIKPDEAKAYLRLCETYASVGLFQEAEDYCFSALDIDRNFGSAYRELGRMQYNRRNYEGAIESFETCVNLGANDIECYYLRGLAHYWLGQCDKAWNVLEESLNLANEPQVINTINTGLFNITRNCVGYGNRSLPTDVPPTPIPPTPIGGI